MRPSTRCSRRSPPFPISLRFPRPADASTTPLDPPKERPRVNVNRRSFLRGTLSGAAGTALAGGVLAGGARADADQARGSGPATETAYPFHGPHQAGVLTPGPRDKQPFASVAAFDCTVATKPDLALRMDELTGRAWFLATGGTPPDLGVGQPPSDSDVLGPTVPADGLTITLSVGSSLFDDRYGLGNRKPLKLTEMQAFPNDFLEPAWLHGDLLLQLCANHPDTIHHAIRDITKHTSGGMQLRWKMEGYASPPRPSGTSRNLLGFKDGTANPTGTLAGGLVWVDDPAEPRWAQGGSYQVVRLIRMLVEFWDRVSINEQQNMFGRRRARVRHPAGLPQPAREPPHQRDRPPADRTPLLQLRPRRGPEREPAGGTHLHGLPAGPPAAVRDDPEAARQRASGRLCAAVRRRVF